MFLLFSRILALLSSSFSSIFIHYRRKRFQDGVHIFSLYSISLCVTTLTDPLTWTVIELYLTINSNDLSVLSKYM